MFPVELAGVLTAAGAAVLAAILAMWYKRYVKREIVPLCVLATTEVICVVAQLIMSSWRPTGAEMLMAVLFGLFGASLAVFGYENVKNALKLAGVWNEPES